MSDANPWLRDRDDRARRPTLAVREQPYTVRQVERLCAGGIEPLAEALRGRRALVVTTPTVARLYGRRLVDDLLRAGIDATIYVTACSEDDKSVERVLEICRELQRLDLEREGVVVGFGGGVVLDLAKVAASWYRRGIRFVAVPTTLIGQCDAGIGIKGAINHGRAKSALGSFHPPTDVLIDPELLATVPAAFTRGGLAEIVKIGIVCDEALFDRVERHGPELLESAFQRPREAGREILWDSIEGMLAELETNFYEDRTYKRLVDFGHTFSPCIEADSGFAIPHGDAVAIDMAISSGIARRLGLLERDAYERVIESLMSMTLPVHAAVVDPSLRRRALEAARHHRGGAVNLVVPTTIGDGTFLTDEKALPAAVFDETVAELAGVASRRATVVPAARPRRLVFDLGGTTLRGARYRRSSATIEGLIRRPAPGFAAHPGLALDALRARLADDLRAMAGDLLDGADPTEVTLAFPGPVTSDGSVLAAPTLWGAADHAPVPLADDLRRLWPSARIHVLNDVSAAGYRYVEADRPDLCILTVSSGIGQKSFIDGKPVVGPAGRGGEIGHLRVDFADDAPPCDCGGRGHLGAIASGRGAQALARRRAGEQAEAFAASALAGRDPDTAAIVEAYRAGDPWTVGLVRELARALGRAIASIQLSTGIERFIVFGGFALALGEPYRVELARAAQASGWSAGADWNTMIELGAPDDASGLVGAGRYAAEFAS